MNNYIYAAWQVVGWTLLQVVVAVLIDNFTAASEREKESTRRNVAAREGKNVAVRFAPHNPNPMKRFSHVDL